MRFCKRRRWADGGRPRPIAAALATTALALVTNGALASPAPLFAADETLVATIEAPMGILMRERSEDVEYDGVFRYVDDAGEGRALDVAVRIRGKFRARRDICDFAPLRLNFRKSQVRDTLFDGQDKLKLVTHCESAGSYHEQFILREYLAYRFLATVTDRAFRVRLLRITYVDSEKARTIDTKYAFLIEHKDSVAERIGADLARIPRIAVDDLDRVQTNLVTVFAYFIGNTDFSAVMGPKDEYCCHNVELFEETPGTYVPIPYDFDQAGIVDAPYATPNPRFPIESVTERHYRGLCRNNELLDDTLTLFTENRGEFNRLIEITEGMNSSTRAKLRRYIDRFYKAARDERRVTKTFVNECFTVRTAAQR